MTAYRRKGQRPKDVEALQDYLANTCPGRDVKVTFRTRDRRELNGYWCWSLASMQHEFTPKRTIEKRYSGNELQVFLENCITRSIRWEKTVLKTLARMRNKALDREITVERS